MFPGGLVVRFNPFTAMAQVQSLVEEWRYHTRHAARTKITVGWNKTHVIAEVCLYILAKRM